MWHTSARARTARYGKGQRWQAVWLEGGKERKKSFPNKDAAREHLVWVTHHQKTTGYVSADRGRVFVRDLLPDWLGTLVQVKASTMAAIRSDVKATIAPYWGDQVLADIRRADVQAWVSAMGKAPRTVDTICGRFTSFMGWCVDQRLITENPCKGVNLPRGRRREHSFLTVSQVAALADVMEPRYRDLVWLLASTGLRMGEACELRWKDVDLGRGRLRVERAVVFVSGGGAVVGTPKSGKARTVPLTGRAAAALGTPGQPEDLVFTTSRGSQIRANNFKRRHFDPAVLAAGLPAGLWVHDLRHTAASWAVQSGASVKSVQRMLGHATAAMTLDVYAGLFDEDLDDVAARMDELMSRPAKLEPLQDRYRRGLRVV